MPTFKRFSLSILLIPFFLSAQTATHIPHLTDPDGDFQTTIVVQNTTDQTQNFRLIPYDSFGYLGASSWESVAARETKTFMPEVVFEDQGATHFRLDGFDDENVLSALRIGVSYSLKNGMGSPAYVWAEAAATKWRFLAGNWDLIFEGFAVVNTGFAPAQVTLRQLDPHGHVIKEQEIAKELPAFGKTLYSLGNPEGSIFDLSQSNIFELTSDQPIVLTVLQSDLPGSRYLWKNHATH